MIVGRRLRLKPDKSQEEWLKQNAGVSRFIYNFSLAMKEDAYKNKGIVLGQKEIMRQITDMKYTAEYKWLQSYSSETIKQAVKDMLKAYSNFFKRGCRGYPRFKKKGKCKEGFYVRYDRVYSVDEKHIKFPSLTLVA
jgi:putative transposase